MLLVSAFMVLGMLMKRVMLVTTKYTSGNDNKWLTNELAEGFVEEECLVSVIALSWNYEDGGSGNSQVNGVDIYRLRLFKFLYSKNILCSFLKIVFFSVIAAFKYGRIIRAQDVVIATTPCIVIWCIIGFMARSKAFNYLILWDFFPFYMKGMWGKSKAVFFRAFWWVENILYNRFDCIGCMTSEAERFLYDNYNIRCAKTSILPLWGGKYAVGSSSPEERKSIRQKYGVGVDSFVVVYGGAMSVVQGLDNVLDAAKVLSSENSMVEFVFIGTGSELSRLKDRKINENIDNILFLDYVPRSQYEIIIRSFDLGLISLSGHHEVPSFPSKSIDYIKVGLPIVAAIDSFTDFSAILKDEMKAGESVVSNCPIDLANKIRSLSYDPELLREFSENGKAFYESNMRISVAVGNILNEFGRRYV